ncbi:MAG: hypothetical protein ACKV2Q_00265 [Planctomycetaceae bacterium]
MLLMLALAGCGAKRPAASVSGTVKYGGESVTTGSIRFDPVDANDAKPVGVQMKEGKYEIPLEAGLVAGEYLVAIYATRETGKLVAPPETLHNTPSTPTKEVVQYIPEAYNANTKLKVTLKAGANSDQNFDLQVGEKPMSSTPSAPGPSD